MMDGQTVVVNIAIGVVAGVCANILSLYLIPKLVPGDRPRPRPVPTLWSVVFVGYVIVALYLVEQRWLIPFEQRFAVVGTCAAVVVVLTVLLRLMVDRPWEELFVVALVPAALIVLSDPVFPRGVDLDCPAIVADEEVVKGRVQGASWHVNVLVHPLRDPDWWVQQVPVVDLRRNWEVRAVFGGASGDRFQLMAIALPEGLLFRDGDTIRTDQIPRTAFKSRLCRVEKR